MNKKTGGKENAPRRGEAKAKQLSKQKYNEQREQLRQRIINLAARISGLGVEADIYALSIVELRGLYAFLKRLAGD